MELLKQLVFITCLRSSPEFQKKKKKKLKSEPNNSISMVSCVEYGECSNRLRMCHGLLGSAILLICIFCKLSLRFHDLSK